MSRAQFRDTVMLRGVSDLLKVPSAAQVAVYDVGTSTPIADTLYADATSATTLSNPMTAQPDGLVTFWTSSERQMDLVVTCNGYADTRTTVMTDVAGQTTGLPIPLTQNLTFSPDNTYDIGAASASRPRNMYAGGTLNGAVVDRGGQVYNVKAYGAVGDGVVDDTAAIQATFDAAMSTPARTGTVLFPQTSAVYKITATIRVYRSDYAQTHINILCEGGGTNGVTLSWSGPRDANVGGVALYMLNNIGFRCEGLSIAGNTATVGGPVGDTSVGFLMSHQIGGTGTSNGTFINCSASGFNYGFQLGAGPIAAGATSELTFINCSASYCGNGMVFWQQNTLDIQLIQWQSAYCGTGLYATNTGQIFVLCGSSSGNLVDFYFHGGGTNVIQNYRSETGGQFLSGNDSYLTLIGCLVVSVPTQPYSIVNSGWLTMIACSIKGPVQSKSGKLTMTGCAVATAPTSGLAFDQTPVNFGAYFDLRGNTDINNGFHTFPDMTGWSLADSALSAAEQFVNFNKKTFGATSRIWSQDVRNVYGISGTEREAKNLRGSAVFASAGTVNVVFGQAEQQTLTLTGGPSGGNVGITGVGWYRAATIPFDSTAAAAQPLMEAAYHIGTGNILVSGGPWPGTPLVFTYRGTLATGPVYLPKSLGGLLGGVAPACVIARTQVGTYAELDANYTVVVTGSINETFWVTNKATSGFVIHSSNPTSTASVDWHLIR